ncbi:hypothetical protein B0H10DRAFT_2034391 [Mycena sp. CBHHK59/15]|nr:hypothetical protein B0H10DRAFT_2034391 [Mycena sp. CBHHK59/15]
MERFRIRPLIMRAISIIEALIFFPFHSIRSVLTTATPTTMRFVAKICILPALFLSSFAAPLGQIYPDELTKRKHFEHKDASTKDSTLESLILQSQTSSTFDRTSSTTEGPFTAISRTSMNLEPMPVTKSAATQEPSTAISSASLNFEPPPVTKSAATQALTTDVFDSFSTVTFSTDVSTQASLFKIIVSPCFSHRASDRACIQQPIGAQHAVWCVSCRWSHSGR